MSATRSFVFLQGGGSPFFRRLAETIAGDGHAVLRVNFNGGDWSCWGHLPAINFRDAVETLPAFYEEIFAVRGVSDVVLYNDNRPVHLPAIALARRLGLRVHVFEEGYFRPHYITLERGGVNANSPLPRDPAWYREAGSRLAEPASPRPFRSGFVSRARHDIAFEIANLGNPIFFPRYRTHVPYNRWLGYAAHLRRMARAPIDRRLDHALISGLAGGATPHFFLPLQLESDAQIRRFSAIKTMSGVIRHVMESFAANAPSETQLVIKNHPLDPGFVNFRVLTAQLARDLGVAGRVGYVETGDASALLGSARGVVTVNSTVGLSSIARGVPTITLGEAFYNLPGLTFQGPLDAFWQAPAPPDPELFGGFRRTVVHATQLSGGYYTDESVTLAVDSSRERILADRSPLEILLQEVPLQSHA